MAAKALPAQSVLLQLLSYDPETGELFWKERGPEHFTTKKISAEKLAGRWNAQFAGEVAGSPCGNRYLGLTIQYAQYLAHRIIWKMLFGRDPDNIDHVDGDRANNRLANLRGVSAQDNHRNKCTPVTNTSGIIGVYFDGKRNKWCAAITDSGRAVFIGRYDTLLDAAEARKNAEIRLGFHPNHGRAA